MGETRHEGVTRVLVNNPEPIVRFQFAGRTVRAEDENVFEGRKVDVSRAGGKVEVSVDLEPGEHILGLGEKAFEVDRLRTRLVMWNTDAYGYSVGTDPLYVSIPFFMSVRRGKALGFFFNSTGKVVFDLGVEDYGSIKVEVPEKAVEFFLIRGPRMRDVLSRYARLTGMPFMPPRWSLGHHVSRWSYTPQATVLEVAKRYKAEFPISSIYLDIGYMDEKKVFTWGKDSFPDPRGMIEKLHSLGVRVVTIIDPGIKVSKSYRQYLEGRGTYCRDPKGGPYVAGLWPGKCVFPDFVNEKARRVWKGWIREWAAQDIDGLWLDMNEPAAFNDTETFDDGVVHVTDEGKRVAHKAVHNAYAYYEAKATFEAFSEVCKEPFMITRSGYAGIQKYSAVWTGDSTAGTKDIRLQLSVLLGLGLSGVPFVGCDLGGFAGRTDPELLVRYYQAGTFFPLFRNHKENTGNDQELFLLPGRYREEVKRAMKLRSEFEPYLYSLAYQSHLTGEPIMRAVAYEFQEDEDAYHINDQYMVGPSLLFAPRIERGSGPRDVYLPAGRWMDWWSGEELEGKRWVSASAELPLYVRHGSLVPTQRGLLVYGGGSFLYYDGREARVTSDETGVRSSRKLEMGVDLYGLGGGRVNADGAARELRKDGKHAFVQGPFERIEVTGRR